jgi:energy-coupling factor transporter ATP-binding protein EcfA2
VVVIEHHMDLIMAIADRIVVIDQGRNLPRHAGRDPAQRGRAEAYRDARGMTHALQATDLRCATAVIRVDGVDVVALAGRMVGGGRQRRRQRP